MDFAEALKDRAVFITGADGFMGSHLTERLVAHGARVHAFIRATSSHELNNIGHLRGQITIHRGDLTDRHSVMSALSCLRGEKEPVVLHLAAQAHVGESWERPYETMAVNVMGTLNLLQSIRDLRLEPFKVVVSGSSEEYGNVSEELRDCYRFKDGQLLLDERSPVNPKSVYAVSKVATDFLARAYYEAYDIPAVVTRMFNNYGPRQNPRYVTATVITQALSQDTVEVGYTQARRDFCYCEDGVNGHLATALYGEPGNVYVYGQGKNISIGDWLQLILDVGERAGFWEGGKRVVYNAKRGRLGRTEVETLLVDYSKLNRISGWTPTFTWEEGLRRTIQWYADNRQAWIGRVDWL